MLEAAADLRAAGCGSSLLLQGVGDWSVCAGDAVIGQLHVTARALGGVWAATSSPRQRTSEPFDADAHGPLLRLLDPEEPDGLLAVEIQGVGLGPRDRIALLANNQTCGVDDTESSLELRIDGRVGAPSVADFARWEPRLLSGPESLFDAMPGRNCPLVKSALSCPTCGKAECLRRCAEKKCVAAQIPRA